MLRLLSIIHVLMVLFFGFSTYASQITPLSQPSQSVFPQKRPISGQGPRVLPPRPGTQETVGIPNQQPTVKPTTHPLLTPSHVASALETCQSEENKSSILVLSIDGAAVRGIAQFELLLAIE